MINLRITARPGPLCTLFALPLLAGLLLAGGNAMAIEEPAYEVVRSYGDFELRRYAPLVVAETEVSGPFERAGNEAFRILAGYIFGDNRSSTKIEMTAPVTQQPKDDDGARGERIEMTAPVIQRPRSATDADSFVFSFVMPGRFTLETLPRPTDARVQLREKPARLMAVHRYSGRWTEANYREHETLLLDAVREAGLTPVAPPEYARYNSPFSLWFQRRNEVMLEVVPPPPSVE
jgi:hypothetical protein